MVERKKGFQVLANGVMIFLSICCLLPFVLMLSSSVTDEKILISEGYALFPKKWSLDAYRYLLADGRTILRGYLITILVTFVGTTVNILLTVMLSYPLSRKELPYRNAISFFIFFTMLFNGGLVPSYLMWTQLFHIKNTIWALIIPTLLLNAFFVMMMRSYFTANIPTAVLESARVDGAGEFLILFRIVLPMSVPMLATLGLMVGLSYWNDWMNGLYYVTNRELFSIQNILNRMLADVQFLSSGMAGSKAGELSAKVPSTAIKMALAVIGIVPVMILYPFFQKYFVKGITVGAVKG